MTAVSSVGATDQAERRSVIGWILYDLANTIFSINIASNYFPDWVVDDQGGRDAHFAVATGVSMALMFISAPLIGAVSDHVPRRVPLLMATTIGCCTLTALLGSGGLWGSLVIFVIANYLFQAGLIFYDALLGTVSRDDNRGQIGGIGVGVGYVGSLIGIGAGLAIDGQGGDPVWIFRITAALFLLFAIPCFLWVRERARPHARLDREAVGRALTDLHDTWRRLGGYPDLRRFLAGRVFYTDAANTLIAFMGIYATQEIGFSDAERDLVLVAGILAAIAGGLTLGRVVDRIGPKRSLNRVLVLWAASLLLASAIPLLDLPKAGFWLVAPLAGLALGGTWTADRPLMYRLSPPRHLGQFYGLYAMAGRFAAILGPLIWATIVDWLGWGRPVAVLSLLVMIAIAAVVLRPVDDQLRAWDDHERLP